MGDDRNKGFAQARQDRKIYCGGLNPSTDKIVLREYFSQFGEVEDAHVMRDGATDASRKFGFVFFSDIGGFNECLKQISHELDGKEIEVKKAIPKEEPRREWRREPDRRTKRVFVGGLDQETTKEELEEAFAGTGLVDVKIMTEEVTEKPRGFAFAVFDDYESADRVVNKKWFKVKGRSVECKKAKPKDDMDKDSMRRSGRRSSIESPPHHRDSFMHSQPMDYRMSFGGYGGNRFPDLYDRMPQSQFSSGTGRFQSGYAYSPSPSAGYSYGPSAYDTYPTSRGYGSYMSTPSTPSSSNYTMGSSYGQSSSGYGPSRTSYTEKDRTASRSNFHPYDRR